MKKKILMAMCLSIMLTMPVNAEESNNTDEEPKTYIDFATTQIETEKEEKTELDEEQERYELMSNVKVIENNITENIESSDIKKNILITNDMVVPSTKDFINIKSEPSTTSKSLAKLYDGSAATLIDYVDDDWIKVESGDIIGYVQIKNVVPSEETQKYIEENIDSYEKEIYTNKTTPILVYKDIKDIGKDAKYDLKISTKNNTKVYSKDSLESEEIDTISNEEIDIVSINKKWVEIKYDNKTGFIKSNNIDYEYNIPEDSIISSLIFPGIDYNLEEYEDDYLKIDSGFVNSDDITITAAFNDAELITDANLMDVGGIPEGKAKDLIEYASQFVGNPYVWGGESLTEGCDCSGFTMLIYANYGYSLPHDAQLQASYGTRVAIEDVKPGDLIFYGDSINDIGHVGIYIGNNQLLHASNPSSGIKISEWSYRTPVCAVRLLPEED